MNASNNADSPLPRVAWKTWRAIIVCVTLVACVIGVVAVFGGFAKRTDQRIPIEPGAVVSLGMADVRIDTATAAPSYEGSTSWSIKAFGEVSNTSGIQLDATSFWTAVQVAYTNTNGIHTSKPSSNMTLLGGDGNRQPRSALPPIEGMMPVQFSFYADDGVIPSDGITIGLIPVIYRQNSVLGLDPSKQWTTSEGASQFWVINFAV